MTTDAHVHHDDELFGNGQADGGRLLRSIAGDPWDNPLLTRGSITHRVFSDVGSAPYTVMAVFVLGTVQPAVGQALDQHEPLMNGARSRSIGTVFLRMRHSYEIAFGILLGKTAEERITAVHTLRELHRVIQGRMPDGSRYHAWQRDVWAYAWLGIFMGIIEAYDFARGFTSDRERFDAIAGCIEVGKLFGVAGIPETQPEFEAYWDNFVHNEAASNAAVQYIMEQVGPDILKPAKAQWIPQPVWAVITLPMRRVFRVGVVATFPAAIKTKVGFRETRVDRVEAAIHRRFWRVVPKRATEYAGQSAFRVLTTVGRPAWKGAFSEQKLAERRASLGERS
ncbi:oxygenase MpaB family protein [Nocardia sp. NPDC051833]|uniref:oxygenase MpaB family protein n=1 Tax=Nocardia sp. NPDC051833 TaxID=3155674 RepID=UPI003419C445